MYFITCLAGLPSREEDGGDIRTFGYFKSLHDAEKALVLNTYDMHETMYNYAVIERIGEGIHPNAQAISWFEYDRQKDSFVPIERVNTIFVNFALG